MGIIGTASFGYSRFFNRPSEAVPVVLVPVTRSNVELTVTESGTIELGGQQTLKSPHDVTVEQVNVKEGDRVQQGQALLILRDRETQDKLQTQQVETGKFQLDLARNRDKVDEAQQRLKLATGRYQAAQNVFRQGAISGSEFQRFQDELEKANTEFKDSQTDLQKSELETRKGQEKLIGMQQQLSDRIVTAPISGMVLKVNVKNGDGTKTESNLLTIGDPAKEVVKLQLTTLNAAKVRINQPAKVSVIGPDAKTFTGRVISLSPQATSPREGESSNTGMNSGGLGNEQAKVEARVMLDRPSTSLIPGSLVSVEVITDQRQNVVAIPPEAVQRTEASPFVWVKDAQGKAQKQLIALGLQGLQQVEVTSGLNQNDQIVLASPSLPLTVGTPLKLGSPPQVSPEGAKP
ncbi:HlyD family efflux transporter periplasmic adaptor subunit [Leptolyngbya sp. FACHB-161]|nr:HlyD family efflux transporter periplasmic adaptor subunit [Leptolyngbya sp. FACHB-161]MBD2371113.1 HlyD family efflux transporter periplasmic adaptor subunit [Leptolyngbya sp. FACHB-161]MBD2377581.1 HlyD family efflux transporter periplasmic adaptor subunit [Leptolyngbya sp. FACHB-238]MBD2402034.1 HlyD family efflux transporter periplasmic adaptor subunit [Leptolyngbya sp. FACHB-239]